MKDLKEEMVSTFEEIRKEYVEEKIKDLELKNRDLERQLFFNDVIIIIYCIINLIDVIFR